MNRYEQYIDDINFIHHILEYGSDLKNELDMALTEILERYNNNLNLRDMSLTEKSRQLNKEILKDKSLSSSEKVYLIKKKIGIHE